ncbi:SMC3, partial [Symbiodinium microadriaticum]
MKELERRKAGRLTFLPLNQLRVQSVVYPDTTDVQSLMEVALDYDPEVEYAIKQVFGKKLLARDLDVAARYSRECQLDAITRDGDVVSRKGGFEGGFRDDRASKIASVMKIRAATSALASLQEKEVQLREKCNQAEQSVNDVLRELQRIEAERDHVRSNASQISKELASHSRQQETALANIEKRKNGFAGMESEIAAARQQVVEYTAEMQMELNIALTPAERTELRSLEERAQSLQEEIGGVEGDVMALATAREKLKADLRDNLHKRQAELQASLVALGEQATSSSSSGKRKGRSASRQETPVSDEDAVRAELDRAELVVREVEAELDAIDAKIQEKKIEVSQLDQQLESLRKDEQRAQEDMTQATKAQDRLLNKRSMLLETSQQKQKLIRELGSLPRKELDDFKNLSEKNLLSSLKDVNEQLKAFSGVNRKALDQYISFNDSLDEDKSSIQQLMDSLDMQKEQTILNTFQGVSKHFADVFGELVPGGEGKLVMITAADVAAEDREDEGGVAEREEKGSPPAHKLKSDSQASVSAFLGVQVKVSFSETSQQFEMKQLSGGQKALVALALIFAIQRCDPAPFYLFDEIDQALDANYRAGVARLIQKQVNSAEAPAQFITTTFRPELVAVANRCYGIALQNKNSRIYPLEKVSDRASIRF